MIVNLTSAKYFTHFFSNVSFACRKLIWYGTEQYSRRRKYKLLDGTETSLCDSNDVIVEQVSLFHPFNPQADLTAKQAKRTKLYDFTRNFDLDLPAELNNVNYETVVEVVEGDCLEEAVRLKELGFNPAVLNMASAKRAGGGTIEYQNKEVYLRPPLKKKKKVI